MFKLESYITPILLSYVAKYVKNFRDEDAQVSLWEGEVTFQNLDLRLDVLEEELNLPFELVSGHIHELSIQVPWTKLTSEPVRIEINTIEFVAKMPNEESMKRRSAALQEQRQRRKLSVTDDQPAAAISSGVVNKIINNITLQCNNIILKYVEDDIVVSMNIQYLNFCAADKNWQPAMVDVNPIAVLNRRLLQVSDFTICLDKRNTAGRIEVCQEPVLYRCTLEVRVLRKFNVNTASTSSTTRIGIFTKSLDINVSTLQLPMAIKLVQLLLELKPPPPEEDALGKEDSTESANSGASNTPSNNDASGSVFRRAWNLLPSFESNSATDCDRDPIGHAFEIGIYAEELNFQLKNSEIITDQAMGGMKRIRYTPVMRISLGGIYYERSLLKENDWSNVRAGLSSICMEPLGVYRSDDPLGQHLVDTKEFIDVRAFIDKSLFDEKYGFAERAWCSYNHDDYYARNTDEYMLHRSPVLAFDIVECRATRPSKSQIPPEAQLKDLGLRVKYRVLSAGITFHFTQSFLQVKNVISDLLRPYDYPGYHAESSNECNNALLSKDQEPWDESMTAADLEYLIGFMPTRNYSIEFRDITVKFYPRQQSAEGSTAANQHRLMTTVKQSLLPYLQLKLSHAEGVICVPANPQRLAHLIAQLQDKPREIVDSCYKSYKFNVKNLTLMALNTTPNQGAVKLISIPSMQVQFNRLLFPTFWRLNVVALETAEVNSELISIEFSKRELVLLTRIVGLLMCYNSSHLNVLAKMVAQANITSDVIKLQTLVTKLRFNYLKYHTHLAIMCSLRNLNADVFHTTMNVRNVVLATHKGDTNKWLEMQLQLPLEKPTEDNNQTPATAVCLWIEGFHITLDINLLQFLNSYIILEKTVENDAEIEFDTFSQSERVPLHSQLSTTSVPKLTQSDVNVRRISRSNTRKISNPAETIHASSERDEKLPLAAEPIKMPIIEPSADEAFDLTQLMNRLSAIVVVLKLAKGRIDVCEMMQRRSGKDVEMDVEFTSIQLTNLTIKSSNGDEVTRGNIRNTISVTNNAELCNWVMDMHELYVCYRQRSITEMILEPVRTTIALALSHKVVEKPQKPKTNVTHSKETSLEDIDTNIDNKRSENRIKAEECKRSPPSSIAYSINVHVDMSAINIFGRHMKLLHDHFKIINIIAGSISLFTSSSYTSNGPKSTRQLEIYTGSFQNNPILREFLDLDPNCEPSAKETEPKPEATLVFFCQWTIPRISFEVETLNVVNKRKLLLIFEDLLLNVDRHEDFTKVTTKVENVNLNYYEAGQMNEWNLCEEIHIKMLGDSTNLPLINIVITTVNLQDLYSKIGARNLNNKRRTISELLIEVQPIEVILNIERITEFLTDQSEILDIMRSSVVKNSQELPSKDVNNNGIKTVQDLPIVHLNSKGIYIYVPIKTEPRCCSVLLMRIERIKLVPSVENPLVRQPVRQDVYNKAAELNMLSTPGALVEDRQYEFSVRNISVSSGNWVQIQKYRFEETLVNKHSNPALEWNNQSRSTELENMDIFKNFDFVTVFAPAINYDRYLVCGESIEFNCLTDFAASVNTHQIHMMTCIISHLQKLQSLSGRDSVEPKASADFNSQTTLKGERKQLGSVPMQTYKTRLGTEFQKRIIREGFMDVRNSSEGLTDIKSSCQSDSGINLAKDKSAIASQSSINLTQDIQTRHSGLRTKLTYPRSVSFVAGIFTLKLYDVLEINEKTMLRPLLLVTASQPSFMATKTLRASITQASVFDFSIHLAKWEAERNFVSYNDSMVCQFSEPIFNTSPGTLGSSGIPPPLLSVKTQTDRTQQVEVDVELRKPMELHLCENSVKLALNDLMRIYSLLSASSYFFQRRERPVVRTTPLRQLKLHCFNADRLHVACDRMRIRFCDDTHSYDCSATWLDFNVNVKFTPRPEKASIRSTLGSVYVQTGDKILLHPLLMRFSADLLSEKWCEQLLISITLKLNVLHLDASTLSILHLSKARQGMNSIMAYINNEWKYFLYTRPMLGHPPEGPAKTHVKYTPTQGHIVRSKSPPKAKAEFYQDDLRAGAFQFVYLNTDTMLPMPYQVQIIKKNYGIICWRYPQPRKMSSIHIYPVPMAVEKPIHIKCRMEYFSETHETFLHYCDFNLSEVASMQLTPPERTICATIWRVVIMQSLISVDGTCFETDEDEEMPLMDNVLQDFRGKTDNDFILHPKVLVGCMRIDTTFQAELVPKLQILLCCQNMELNLLNQPDASNLLPPLLTKYHLRRTTERPQTFLTIHVDDLKMHSAIYRRDDYSVETDFRSRIKCLDYGFLNMLEIMEPTSFHSYLRFSKAKRLLQANFLLDKLRFNCGPCIIHTLLCSKQHWRELLQQRDVVHTLMPRCVIVNRMHMPFTFGQSGTGERISVAPLELRPYYFCSERQDQELMFFVENTETCQVEVSDPLHIPLRIEEDYLVRHLRIGQRVITIKQGKLSATQMYILVKGQIELVSMMPFELLAEFRSEDGQADDQGQNALGHLLAASDRISFHQAVVRNADITMRLKLGTGCGKGRTGDIPLKPNNSLPWLVKIPTHLPQQFISVWVRILREDVEMESADDFHPQRIFVSIWPIFEICNLLSYDLKALESSTEESFIIPSQGGRHALTTATTHSTKHRVNFEFPCTLGPNSQSEFTFLLKSMDWHKFFHYDHADWTIEKTLQRLDESIKPKWPLSDDEELRVKRSSGLLNLLDVQYRAQATREFSCTMGLQITAWAVLINATGLDVAICLLKERTRYEIKANCLELMPLLGGQFTIDGPLGCQWTSSSPIFMENSSVTTPAGRNLILRANSYVDIVLIRKEQVLRLVLDYKLEDGRRVLKLRSKFIIANFTDMELQALPLTMDHKETSGRGEVNALASNPNNCKSIPIRRKNQSVGITLEVFHDLNAHKAKHTADTAFVYFVCFAVGGHQECSIPIPLAVPFARRCFNLQKGCDSVPLMITLIEKDNIYYLNVFRDTSPALIISNNTSVRFIVAQTSASGNSNVSCTTAEFTGKHFEWNQFIAPHSKCYYTPPQMYSNFPDVEFTMCNLSLALYNESVACGKSKLSWSKPIRTDKSWKKFIHVPNHGDIKVTICDKHRAIRFNIYYIAQQLEFSVKDLRLRLTQPETNQSPLPEEVALRQEEPAVSTIEQPADECSHFTENFENKLQVSVRLFMKSFVFSLQTNDRDRDRGRDWNCAKTEVCNMYADDVMLALDQNSEQCVLHVQLPNLQVDNQLFASGKYDFPVLLCAQELYKRDTCLPKVYELDAVYRRQAEQTTMSNFTFTFYEDELQLQAVSCQLQPLRVYIEDAYLNQLLDTLVECAPSSCVYIPPEDTERIQLQAGHSLLPDQVVAQALYIAEPLRLNSFVVQPLSLLLSVHTSSRLYIALDHSPLSFSRYERQQILTVPLRFGQSLGLHYLSGAIFGAGWVVGSLEILGSPSGLARSFTTGLRDFISMPVQGLFRGPWGFLVGVTQGSASLLRNVTAGTVNSVTKLAGSVARNLDRLTLDSEHIELTEARRRARPQGLADGLTQGLTGLGISLLGAVGGLAHHTLEARSSVDVLTGLTKGIVGALTKPISGAAEMLALTGQGVLHTVGFNAMPQQVEPRDATRHVGTHASSYRIWRFLPEQLNGDQILFFQEVTLLVNGQLRPALLILTSTVLAIMEPKCDSLQFVSPMLKVEVLVDREDTSKMYLSLRPEMADDMEGQMKYTNERIISFLNASRAHALAKNSLSDLLQVHDYDHDQEDPARRHTQCIFYIKPNLGEHLMHCLKVFRQT